MASSKDRQRKLARAKVERQMARRAARARRNRRVYAGTGAAVLVVLVVLGVVWGLGGFKSSPKPAASATASCAWTPASTTQNAALKDVGTPPTSNIPHTGTATMTITTNQGVIVALLNAAESPCTVESMRFLAGKQFFDNTGCYKLSTANPSALYCGDPSGTGTGGPAYTYATEYVPTLQAPATPPAATSASPSGKASASGKASETASASPSPSPTTTVNDVIYPRGTIAMAGDGSGQVDTSGSTFFIVDKDSALQPNYTAFGTVTQGMDILDKIIGAGATSAGKPKTTVTVESLVVTMNSTTAAPSPTPAPSPSQTPTPAASATVSPSAKKS